MKCPRQTVLLASLLCSLPLAPMTAGADEPKAATGLPGVDGSYSIVTPAPEPDDAAPPSSGTTKIGKWELTVSGYVWVQVGASSASSGSTPASTTD